VVRLIAQHELTVAQIAWVSEVSRQTVFTDREMLLAGGVASPLSRKRAQGQGADGARCGGDGIYHTAGGGQIRQARNAHAWIVKRMRHRLSESGARHLLRRVDGKLKVPRKSHTKKDPAEWQAFKAELPTRFDCAGEPNATGAPVGARRAPLRFVADDPPRLESVGWRVHAPDATRYQWGYVNRKLEAPLIAAARP
jgi:hypothetical protein